MHNMTGLHQRRGLFKEPRNLSSRVLWGFACNWAGHGRLKIFYVRYMQAPLHQLISNMLFFLEDTV